MITITGEGSHVSLLHFDSVHSRLRVLLAQAPEVDVGEWQALDISGNKALVTHELQNVVIEWQIPRDINALQKETEPSLPWAEDQFCERVGGEPLNPGDTYHYWPSWRQDSEVHLRAQGGKFSHTYMERFWPKYAGHTPPGPAGRLNWGVRHPYGDYDDLLGVLAKSPHTRQAYLPIWFPEDLEAATAGERVPCTLGYHFMLRSNQLHLTYPIRSCDFIRHFRDDVYMAARLCQHTIEQLRQRHHPARIDGDLWDSVTPGKLCMWIGSFHCFHGDMKKLRKEAGI